MPLITQSVINSATVNGSNVITIPGVTAGNIILVAWQGLASGAVASNWAATDTAGNSYPLIGRESGLNLANTPYSAGAMCVANSSGDLTITITRLTQGDTIVSMAVVEIRTLGSGTLQFGAAPYGGNESAQPTGAVITKGPFNGNSSGSLHDQVLVQIVAVGATVLDGQPVPNTTPPGAGWTALGGSDTSNLSCRFFYQANLCASTVFPTATFNVPPSLDIHQPRNWVWDVGFIFPFFLFPVPPGATGNIVIQKATNPPGSPQAFTFTSDYGPPFTLTDGMSNDSGQIPIGTYSVTEEPVFGWLASPSRDPSAIVVDSGASTQLLVHKSFHDFNHDPPSASGTITIPLTTKGNTLVVCAASSFNGFGGLAITDNAGDVFVENANSFPNDISDGPGLGLVTTDIWYCVNIAGGATSVSFTSGGGTPALWVYELLPSVVDDPGDSTDIGNSSFASFDGITLNGTGTNVFYATVGAVSAAARASIAINSANSPWTLDTVAGSDGQSYGSMATAYLDGTAGANKAIFNAVTNLGQQYCTNSISFKGTGSTTLVKFTNTFGSVPPSTPCIPVGGNGVFVSDLELYIGPSTALYNNPVPSADLNLYETVTEGRHAVVLDFNSGEGLYARDLGTIFSWPIQSGTVLYVWQPSIIPMPEGTYGRATDWLESGGAKFIQGVIIEADSFNNAKTFMLQDADTLAMHALNEMPATFNQQSVRAFSCVTPFVAHSARVVSTDGVEWRVWSTKLVFQPWPELCVDWKTELTSLGMIGWGHIRELNVPYVSTGIVTVTITFDAWPTITLTLPSTGGLQAKTKVTIPANKFKLIGFESNCPQGHRIFSDDLQVKIKAWGSTESYQVLRPWGGLSRTGAIV